MGFAWLIIYNPARSVIITPANVTQIRHDVSFWCLMYLMLGLSQLIFMGVMGIIFARASERLIHRVRDQTFRTLLRQDVEYFDRDEHSAGALTCVTSVPRSRTWPGSAAQRWATSSR